MKNLFKALANFQQEVPVIHKGTKGYGYSYADLPTIFEVINPLLKKHGLGFTQLLDTKEGATYIVTCVFHVESGESIESKVEIPIVSLKGMNDYQSFGSGCTYYRRYALSSALCLVTDIDNDGAGTQTPKKPTKKVLNVNGFNTLVGAIRSEQKMKDGRVITTEIAKELYELTDEQLITLNSLD